MRCAPSAAPLQNIVEYFVLAIVSLVLIWIVIALIPELIAASVVFAAEVATAIRTFLAAIALYGLVLPANAASDGCTCGAHFDRCVASGWNRYLPSYGATLCAKCLDKCTTDGGDRAGNWPDSIPTFPGGPVNATLSCNYPGR